MAHSLKAGFGHAARPLRGLGGHTCSPPHAAQVEKHPCPGHAALGPRGGRKRESLQGTLKPLPKVTPPRLRTGRWGSTGWTGGPLPRGRAANVSGVPRATATLFPRPVPPSYTHVCARIHTFTPSSPEGRPRRGPPTGCSAAAHEPKPPPAQPAHDHRGGRAGLPDTGGRTASCPTCTRLKLQRPRRPRLLPAAATRTRARRVTDGPGCAPDLTARPWADPKRPPPRLCTWLSVRPFRASP